MNKLLVLNAATELDELKVPPGNQLESLRGDRAGQHSIRINNQWRICFVWTTADTALRLGRFFGVTAQFWINLQSHYDLEVQSEAIADQLKTIKPHQVA